MRSLSPQVQLLQLAEAVRAPLLPEIVIDQNGNLGGNSTHLQECSTCRTLLPSALGSSAGSVPIEAAQVQLLQAGRSHLSLHSAGSSYEP